MKATQRAIELIQTMSDNYRYYTDLLGKANTSDELFNNMRGNGLVGRHGIAPCPNVRAAEKLSEEYRRYLGHEEVKRKMEEVKKEPGFKSRNELYQIEDQITKDMAIDSVLGILQKEYAEAMQILAGTIGKRLTPRGLKRYHNLRNYGASFEYRDCVNNPEFDRRYAARDLRALRKIAKNARDVYEAFPDSAKNSSGFKHAEKMYQTVQNLIKEVRKNEKGANQLNPRVEIKQLEMLFGLN